jgi:hypothetical protein
MLTAAAGCSDHRCLRRGRFCHLLRRPVVSAIRLLRLSQARHLLRQVIGLFRFVIVHTAAGCSAHRCLYRSRFSCPVSLAPQPFFCHLLRRPFDSASRLLRLPQACETPMTVRVCRWRENEITSQPVVRTTVACTAAVFHVLSHSHRSHFLSSVTAAV